MKIVLRKIGSLKKGIRFEMNSHEFIITRSGHGYPDVEFQRFEDPKTILTTINKRSLVAVIF